MNLDFFIQLANRNVSKTSPCYAFIVDFLLFFLYHSAPSSQSLKQTSLVKLEFDANSV